MLIVIILILIFLLIALVVAVLLFINFLKPKKLEESLYQENEILSEGEDRFRKVLFLIKKQYGGILNECDIQVQVSLISLVRINPNALSGSEIQKIAAKHVDFVLVERKTRKTKLVIELDDKSHLLAHRKERDDFVDKILGEAGIPILHQKVYARYDLQQVYEGIVSKIFH